jgi:para-aminobenzoate synthetase component I
VTVAVAHAGTAATAAAVAQPSSIVTGRGDRGPVTGRYTRATTTAPSARMRPVGAAVRTAVQPLRGEVAPAVLLRRLAARARNRGLPPPAALIGDWFGGTAVLAPSVRVRAVPAADAFAVPDRQPVLVDAPPGVVGGGWVGYLGFGLTDPGPRSRRLPLAAWGWTDHVLRRDNAGRWWFEALVGDRFPAGLTTDVAPNVAPDVAAELAALVRGGDDPPPAHWHGVALRPPDRDQHEHAVHRCMDAIRAGEVYQANVCTRYELRLAGDPVDAFAAGVTRHAPARAACVTGGWGALASLSPELFLARGGRLVRSSPIKGTELTDPSRLAASTKDRAENIMIVDLVRNDLGRVCTTGSITVPELLAVHPAPGVWHLVSTVSGTLQPAVTDATLLAATFPPGSVTGTPKLRALELLAELEPAPREAYCGAIGMVSPAAGLQLNVAIRTLEVAPDGDAWIGVGGGITIGSDPAAEWAECLAKAAPLLDLLGAGPPSRPARSTSSATM